MILMVLLKNIRKLLDEGKMTFRDIDNQYGSWRGTIEKIASYHSLKNMDMLYNELFIKPFIEGRDYYEQINRKSSNKG